MLCSRSRLWKGSGQEEDLPFQKEDSGLRWVSGKVHIGPCTPGFLPFSSSQASGMPTGILSPAMGLGLPHPSVLGGGGGGVCACDIYLYTLSSSHSLYLLSFFNPSALPIFSPCVTKRAQHLTLELSHSLKAFISSVAPGLHCLICKMKPTILALPTSGKIKLESVRERATWLFRV